MTAMVQGVGEKHEYYFVIAGDFTLHQKQTDPAGGKSVRTELNSPSPSINGHL